MKNVQSIKMALEAKRRALIKETLAEKANLEKGLAVCDEILRMMAYDGKPPKVRPRKR